MSRKSRYPTKVETRAKDRYLRGGQKPDQCGNVRCEFHSKPLIWIGKPFKTRFSFTHNALLCPLCYSLLPPGEG